MAIRGLEIAFVRKHKDDPTFFVGPRMLGLARARR